MRKLRQVFPPVGWWLVILLPFLASCAGTPPPTVFAPLNYDYLTKLRLNVASVSVVDDWQGQPGDLGQMSPVPPVEALRTLAQERLFPAGSNGRAVFHIEDASILREGDSLVGHLAVRLDLYAGGDARNGYAEARVSRSAPDPDDGKAELRAALYTLTKQMMDDMNVEFEFQVRKALKDWLEAAPASVAPAPVEQQALPAPGEALPPVPAAPSGAPAGALPPPVPLQP